MTRPGLTPSPDPEQRAQDEHDCLHSLPLEQGLFNDAQPISPPPSDALIPSAPITAVAAQGSADIKPCTHHSIPTAAEEVSGSSHPSVQSSFTRTSTTLVGPGKVGDRPRHLRQTTEDVDPHDLHFDDLRSSRWSDDNIVLPRDVDMVEKSSAYQTSNQCEIAELDAITDTVGAIAVDLRGNVACAASSGGIGMKHRGRVGPAALVGIGASVLPALPTDPLQTTVATVTSGTGEHMATTQAAATCSSRILSSQQRSADGSFEEVTEDEAIRGFIEQDFMAHPSVLHSRSAGAIGVLSVKKTREGVWLYFAHNTDSFALASMSSSDPQPLTTMSRNRGNGGIAGGGRAIKFAKRSKTSQQA